MSFGPVTGAAINPALTLSPAIGAGRMTQVIPYMIAQFTGAIAAALLYWLLFASSHGDEKQSGESEEPAF